MYNLAMKRKSRLKKDFLIIVFSFLLAYALYRFGVINDFLSSTAEFKILGSFVAGLFFTSAFTIAPASVALAGLAMSGQVPLVAFWGALGALFGDLILFFVIRDVFADDLMKVLKRVFHRHIFSSFHLGFIKWLAPFLGALIIASPLPDELGLALMGLSKTRLIVLVPISFIFNFIGILGLVFITQVF